MFGILIIFSYLCTINNKYLSMEQGDTIGYGFPTQDGGHTYGTKCNCPSCLRVRATDALATESYNKWLKERIKVYEENLSKGIVRDVNRWGKNPDALLIHILFGNNPIDLKKFINTIYK